MKYIIFDTDMGTDDAWALIMLAKASSLRDFQIIGITLVHGNTDIDNCAINTMRVLEAINNTVCSSLDTYIHLPIYIEPVNFAKIMIYSCCKPINADLVVSDPRYKKFKISRIIL